MRKPTIVGRMLYVIIWAVIVGIVSSITKSIVPPVIIAWMGGIGFGYMIGREER